MSIEEKMDMLRRKIKDGALGADDARRALRAEIDGELRKAPADVDMDAVNACEALLAELSGAKEETHAAQNLRAIREKLHPQRRAPKRSAAVAALLAAVLVFGGTATVLGLSGNDHTKRLEELQENRTVQVAQITPENETRVTLPIGAQTLTLEQAAQRDILDETGKLRVLAQTLADVDEAGGVRMLLVLAESAEEMHVDGAYLVGFDADGKRLETAVDMSVSPALLAGGKSLLSAEIEPGAMDGAERFEIWLMCTRPSWCTPRSTNAPKSMTLRTVPVSCMPARRSSSFITSVRSSGGGSSSRMSRPGFCSSARMSCSVGTPTPARFANASRPMAFARWGNASMACVPMSSSVKPQACSTARAAP